MLTWAASLGLRDLDTEGSLGGLIVSTPPRVISNAFDADAIAPDTTFHREAFYRNSPDSYSNEAIRLTGQSP